MNRFAKRRPLSRNMVPFGHIDPFWLSRKHKSGLSRSGRILQGLVAGNTPDDNSHIFAKAALHGDLTALGAMHDYFDEINHPLKDLDWRGLMSARMEEQKAFPNMPASYLFRPDRVLFGNPRGRKKLDERLQEKEFLDNRARANTPEQKRRGQPTRFMEDEEAGFHRNLEQDIHDPVSWLVYADWLQEHGRDLDAMMMRHNGKWLEKQWPLIKDNIPSWYRDKGRFFLKQNQPNDRELHLDAIHPPDTSHVLLLVKSKANPQKSLIVQHFIPHETIAPLIKGFEESGGLVQSSGSTPLSKETELDRIKANYPEHFRKRKPTRLQSFQSPAGGLVARGTFYEGGKMLPLESVQSSPRPNKTGILASIVSKLKRKKSKDAAQNRSI